MRHSAAFWLTATLTLLPTIARADCGVVWYTGWTNYTLGPSHVVATEDRETADDFDYQGSIGRVFVNGTGPLTGDYPVDGVWVRFYAWTQAGPGALQHARFVAAADPNLRVTTIPQTIDVVLAPAFVASGKHFISVQVDFAASGGYWQPWTGSDPTPQLSHAWVRDNLGGGGWTPYADYWGPVDKDMSLELYSAPSASGCNAWHEVPTPIPSADYTMLRDIEVIGANDVWAVGHYQQLSPGYNEQITLGMHFDGTQWSITPTPSPAPGPNLSNDYLWAVDSIAHGDVWAGGEQYMQVNGGWAGSQPLAIHWDGTSWTEVPTPLPPTSVGAGYTGSSVLEIEAIAAHDVWFLGRWIGPYPGTSSTRPAMAMHWDGSSISLVPTPVLAGAQSIHAADSSGPNDVWAIGSMSSAQTQYPYVLRWDGSQWSQVQIPPAGATQEVIDISVLALNDVWLLAERNTGTGSGSFLLHYDGTSWTQSAVPSLGSLYVSAANDMWISSWQVEHFNGNAWNVSDDFSCIPGASLLALDGRAGQLWAAGRQLSAGLIPLTVRSTGQSCYGFAYCTSSTSSNGCVATISSVGTPSASASSGFTLRVDNVEGQKQGLLFYGVSGQSSVPWANGSTSVLCVKAPLQRLTSQPSGGLIFQCNGALSQDWNAYMASHPAALGNPRTAGQTLDAQGWFRDPPAPRTTNLSNAFQFVVQP